VRVSVVPLLDERRWNWFFCVYFWSDAGADSNVSADAIYAQRAVALQNNGIRFVVEYADTDKHDGFLLASASDGGRSLRNAQHDILRRIRFYRAGKHSRSGRFVYANNAQHDSALQSARNAD